MSRLHAFMMGAPEVAAHFDVSEAPSIAMPSQVVEGDQGVVIFEAHGRRLLRPMRWGFPRVTTGAREGSIIGLVADPTNPMWEELVVDPRYRCVVPMTHFGNPDGQPGRKTRTWFSVRDQPVMAWAGFCRNIRGVGPVYAGMTTEANAAIPPTNDRMPLLLERDEVDRWLHGSIADVIAFQFRPPFAASRMEVLRTDDPWRGGAPPPIGITPQPSLL